MERLLVFLAGLLVGGSLAWIWHGRHKVFINFALAFRLWQFMEKVEERLSELTDAIADLDTTVVDAEARVSADVAALKAKIEELEAIIAAGTATPEDIAKLKELKQRVANIDPAVVSPTP